MPPGSAAFLAAPTAVTSNNDTRAWTDLLSLPKLALRQKRGGEQQTFFHRRPKTVGTMTGRGPRSPLAETTDDTDDDDDFKKSVERSTALAKEGEEIENWHEEKTRLQEVRWSKGFFEASSEDTE